MSSLFLGKVLTNFPLLSCALKSMIGKPRPWNPQFFGLGVTEDIMRRDKPRVKILSMALAAFLTNSLFMGLAIGAPVTLPSGVVVDLAKEQAEVIKEQPGVFFGAEAADMLGPGEVVISLPAELGGGYIYGRPEHLARAFAAASVTRGTEVATHLFTKSHSSP
jgi:hypothetical protein